MNDETMGDARQALRDIRELKEDGAETASGIRTLVADGAELLAEDDRGVALWFLWHAKLHGYIRQGLYTRLREKIEWEGAE